MTATGTFQDDFEARLQRALGDGYEVRGVLGQGGFGVVYAAFEHALKRDVAIKVLPAAFVSDPERLARFEREAHLLAQLQHPNIASIYGLEESGGTSALVMELVEGDDLSALIARGPLPVAEATAIARQIAEALGENIILLVNLAWSGWLYARFISGRGSFAVLERWQIAYLPIYSAWGALVVVVFPPVFGYR